jgi:hypothetical protein
MTGQEMRAARDADDVRLSRFRLILGIFVPWEESAVE